MEHDQDCIRLPLPREHEAIAADLSMVSGGKDDALEAVRLLGLRHQIDCMKGSYSKDYFVQLVKQATQLASDFEELGMIFHQGVALELRKVAKQRKTVESAAILWRLERNMRIAILLMSAVPSKRQ
ncbi:MAG: hypothetical protein ABJO67_20860 [Pseudoruegeria sp.]